MQRLTTGAHTCIRYLVSQRQTQGSEREELKGPQIKCLNNAVVILKQTLAELFYKQLGISSEYQADISLREAL